MRFLIISLWISISYWKFVTPLKLPHTSHDFDGFSYSIEHDRNIFKNCFVAQNVPLENLKKGRKLLVFFLNWQNFQMRIWSHKKKRSDKDYRQKFLSFNQTFLLFWSKNHHLFYTQWVLKSSSRQILRSILKFYCRLIGPQKLDFLLKYAKTNQIEQISLILIPYMNFQNVFFPQNYQFWYLKQINSKSWIRFMI